MRLMDVLVATILVAGLNPMWAHARAADEQQTGDEQTEPYHKHHDTRHGHDHVYPDRGAIVRDLPHGATVVNYAGVTYRFHDGVWLEPRGPAFVVVEPPIGLMVPTLPSFATPVAYGSETYLYANNVYYRAHPELGGYEVVNDPGDLTPPKPITTAAAGAAPTAATPATAPAAAALVATPAVVAGGVVPAAIATTSAATSAAAPATTGSTFAAAPTSAGGGTTLSAAVPAPTSSPAGSAAVPASTASPTASPAGSTAAPTPPAGSSYPSQVPSSFSPQIPKVFLYPKNGQSADQQARDRYECYRFAVGQTGFDPMHPGGAGRVEQQSDYERAQAACFEGRGYSVK
jgi:Family of unknown function (DUF6515)